MSSIRRRAPGPELASNDVTSPAAPTYAVAHAAPARHHARLRDPRPRPGRDHPPGRRLDRSGRHATGLLTLFMRHTSASLLIQENADPDVRADLDRFFARLVPDGDALFRHRDEGPDDMPAHVRAALTAVQLSIPVADGRLALGTWQGIYLWEHRLRAASSRAGAASASAIDSGRSAQRAKLAADRDRRRGRAHRRARCVRRSASPAAGRAGCATGSRWRRLRAGSPQRPQRGEHVRRRAQADARAEVVRAKAQARGGDPRDDLAHARDAAPLGEVGLDDGDGARGDQGGRRPRRRSAFSPAGQRDRRRLRQTLPLAPAAGRRAAALRARPARSRRARCAMTSAVSDVPGLVGVDHHRRAARRRRRARRRGCRRRARAEADLELERACGPRGASAATVSPGRSGLIPLA